MEDGRPNGTFGRLMMDFWVTSQEMLPGCGYLHFWQANDDSMVNGSLGRGSVRQRNLQGRPALTFDGNDT